MTGFICDRCPLAFEVGYYGYWDLSGGCVKYVCRKCGTMHKIEHLERQPDILYAAPGPVRGMVDEPFELAGGETHILLRLPITEESWRQVGPLPTAAEHLHGPFILPHRAKAVAMDNLACAYCGEVGGLVSSEWSRVAVNKEGPLIRELCPVCEGPLLCMNVDTIN